MTHVIKKLTFVLSYIQDLHATKEAKKMSNSYSLNLNGIKVNPETLRNKHTQIAKRARLHQTTVSLILNRSRKSFKPETIDKVRDAIIDLFSNVYVVTEPAKLPYSKRVTQQK